jgi:hypothetical protein
LQHVWAGEQPKKAYKDFVGQMDRMVDAQVRWTPYAPAIVAARAPQGLSSLCSRDQAYWLTRRRLVFDVYVEEYAVPAQVLSVDLIFNSWMRLFWVCGYIIF